MATLAAGNDGVKRRKTRRTQRERSAATIDELLRVSRQLFAERGYNDASLDDVVDAAGVTKGAVYHHFKGKQDLFRAVYEQEQKRLVESCLAASARKRDLKQRFLTSCEAFFEASLDPAVQRITLVDAPAALGLEQMREIEYRYTLALVIDGLELAMDRGLMPRRPVLPLAHLIFGAMCEAAMLVALSENQRAVSRQVFSELTTLIGAFF